MVEIDSLLPQLRVSRETIERLRLLGDLVCKWSNTINLVSPSQLGQLWDRHIIDSAQLYPLAPCPFDIWLDIGTGAGFPGLVIATLASDLNPKGKILMVESDGRKAAFLQSTAARLGLFAEVIIERAENIRPMQADVVSARAVAPLDKLLSYAILHLRKDGHAFFPKGKNIQEELRVARASWQFSLALVPSVTDAEACIATIRDLKHVG